MLFEHSGQEIVWNYIIEIAGNKNRAVEVGVFFWIMIGEVYAVMLRKMMRPCSFLPRYLLDQAMQNANVHIA